MTENIFIPLAHRATLKLSGADARGLLQGIITNNIDHVSPERAIYACLLTPQGKYLADFFILDWNGDLFLDVSGAQLPALKKKLTMYKLRSDVTIEDVSDAYEVAALIGPNLYKEDGLENATLGATRPFCKGIAYIDPRDEKIGGRAIIARENNYQSFEAKGFTKADSGIYEQQRLERCLPESDRDLIVESSFPLPHRMEQLHAVDFNKGCYVGQEVTARSKHRGNIRKTLFVLEFISPGNTPETGSAVLKDGKKIGTSLSGNGVLCLALLEKDAAEPHAAVEVDGLAATLRC